MYFSAHSARIPQKIWLDLLWDEGKAKLAVIDEGKLGNMAAMAAILDENSAWSGELFVLWFSSAIFELWFKSEALSTEDWSICKGLFSLLFDCKGFNSPFDVCSSCKCFIIPWRRSFSLVSCSSSWLTICNWTRVCACKIRLFFSVQTYETFISLQHHPKIFISVNFGAKKYLKN